MGTVKAAGSARRGAAASLNRRRIQAIPAHASATARMPACAHTHCRQKAMNLLSSVTGEMSDSKVAAVFDDESEARAIARQVQHMLHMQPAQVQVVTPHDARPGRKLEPEGRGICLTILVAHYRLGLAGLGHGFQAHRPGPGRSARAGRLLSVTRVFLASCSSRTSWSS